MQRTLLEESGSGHLVPSHFNTRGNNSMLVVTMMMMMMIVMMVMMMMMMMVMMMMMMTYSGHVFLCFACHRIIPTLVRFYPRSLQTKILSKESANDSILSKESANINIITRPALIMTVFTSVFLSDENSECWVHCNCCYTVICQTPFSTLFNGLQGISFFCLSVHDAMPINIIIAFYFSLITMAGNNFDHCKCQKSASNQILIVLVLPFSQVRTREQPCQSLTQQSPAMTSAHQRALPGQGRGS